MEQVVGGLIVVALLFVVLLLPLVLSVIAMARTGSLDTRLRRLEEQGAAVKKPSPVTSPKPIQEAAKPLSESRVPDVGEVPGGALADTPIALAKPTTTEEKKPEPRKDLPTLPLVPVSPPPPPPPSKPPTETKAAGAKTDNNALEMFVGRRLISVAGILMVLLAVAFGLAYMIQHYNFPPEMRLVGSALLGLGLIGGGIRMHRSERMRNFALVLMGGGAGVLYLTIYAAYGIHHLMGQTLAAVGLVAVAGLTLTLAAVYGAQTVALIGTVGAFSMPFMVASAAPQHDFFLAYLLIINLPVMALGYRRRWQLLYNGAFAATAIIGLGWLFGYFSRNPGEHLARAEWFWAGFAVEYLALALLKLRSEEAWVARGADVCRLALLTVLLGGVGWYVLEEADLQGSQAAFFVGLAAVYLALAVSVRRWRSAMIGEFLLFFCGAAGFLAIAVPLHFDGAPVALLWGVEGVAVMAYGLKLRHAPVRILGGFFLAIGAGHALVGNVEEAVLRSSLCLNAWFATVLAMAALFVAVAELYRRWGEERLRSQAASMAMALAWVVAVIGFSINASLYFPVAEYAAFAIAAATIVAVLAWSWTGKWLADFRPLGQAAPLAAGIAMLPALITLLAMMGGADVPVSPWCFTAWAGLGVIAVFWSPNPARQRPAGAVLATMGLLRALIIVPQHFPTPERWFLNDQMLSALASCVLLGVIAWRTPWERRRQATETVPTFLNFGMESMIFFSLMAAALFSTVDAIRVHGFGETAMLLGEAGFVAVAAALLLACPQDPRWAWWRRIGMTLLLAMMALLVVWDLLWFEQGHGSILANRIFLGQFLLLAGVISLLLLTLRRTDPQGSATLRAATGLTAATAGLVIVGTELSRLHQVYQVPQDWSGMAVTIWVTLFAVTVCLIGIGRRSTLLRRYGFAVLAFAMLRIIGDIWDMADPARIFALFGAGILFLSLSYIYHRVAVPWLTAEKNQE